MKRSSKKGFTLIELIIVIAILAILAVVIIPKITGTKDNAQIGVNRTNAKQIQGALAQYYTENDTYPAQQHDYEQVLKEKIGKIPAYKNGTAIGSYLASDLNGTNYTNYTITFVNDSGTSIDEASAGTVHTLTPGVETNSLWK